MYSIQSVLILKKIGSFIISFSWNLFVFMRCRRKRFSGGLWKYLIENNCSKLRSVNCSKMMQGYFNITFLKNSTNVIGHSKIQVLAIMLLLHNCNIFLCYQLLFPRRSSFSLQIYYSFIIINLSRKIISPFKQKFVQICPSQPIK